MRGAIALIIGGGLLLVGAVPGKGMAVARPAGPVAAAGTRIVVYDGYEISVPDSWPVYRLDSDPSQCVRYDRHAVYLGLPGVNQQCPAGLIGRTETVSIMPVATYGPSAGTEQFTAVAGLAPRARGVVVQNPSDQVLQVVPVADRSVTVTATYGSGLALAEQLLATLQPAPAGTPRTPAAAGTTSSSAAGGLAAGGSVPAVSAAAPAPQPPRQDPALLVTSSWHGLPTPWPLGIQSSPVPVMPSPAPSGSPSPSPSPSRPRSPSPSGSPSSSAPASASPPVSPTPSAAPSPSQSAPPRPRPGFDTCALPSQATLRAWHRAYSVVAVYIGGVNAACYTGNLSSSWINGAAHAGWSMLPTYVGPQSPCYGYGQRIRPAKAAQEGTMAAQDAAWDAWRLGLPAHSPIYYDMEAYIPRRGPSCSTAVLAFLGAWTREINAKGYASGVYSSVSPVIVDIQLATTAHRRGFTPPQAIWYALWNRRRVLGDVRLSWPQGQRSKQYIGPHNARVGAITMNIDSDFVEGPTAR